MSENRNSQAALTGIALGAVVLALVVVFAVFIPKAHGDDGSASSVPTKAVTLPGTLPGGYTAVDLDAIVAKGTKDQQAGLKSAVAYYRAEKEYANAALKKVLDAPAASRAYTDTKLQNLYFVQVFRASGGAFAPGELSDPAKASQGDQVQQLVRTGNAICIVTSSVGTSGQLTLSQTQCQRSAGQLTVQVSVSGVAASDVAKFADAVWAKVK